MQIFPRVGTGGETPQRGALFRSELRGRRSRYPHIVRRRAGKSHYRHDGDHQRYDQLHFNQNVKRGRFV